MSSDMEMGILAYGAYLPRRRLRRKSIAAANSWFAPGLRGLAKGERAMANWDEDAVTMALEAARDCLKGLAPAALEQLILASTTHPYDDRQNAAIIANAMHLGSTLRVLDVTGSQRSGTSALINALAGGSKSLVASAEHRLAKAASLQEMHYGDGAAALLVGRGKPIARLLGAHSETVDFVHQFRSSERTHDYAWEERWIRDEGYMKLVPTALAALFKATGVAPGAVTHFCLPCTLPRVISGVAKRAGIAETAVRDNLAAVCGDTGAAHALLLLAHALSQAKAGDLIAVAAFGQGCDALLFEATDAIETLPPRDGVTGALARGKEETNYLRFLAFNDHVALERGMRAEVEKGTPLTTLYRNRDMITGLVGGRCRTCGTLQFPRGRYCVNPKCNALDSQDPHAFSEVPAKVMSYTTDMLTYSADPPAYYGMVEFDAGGRMMAEFTDIDHGKVEVGMPMRMMFRIKEQDAVRGFVRYFWKAAPA